MKKSTQQLLEHYIEIFYKYQKKKNIKENCLLNCLVLKKLINCDDVKIVCGFTNIGLIKCATHNWIEYQGKIYEPSYEFFKYKHRDVQYVKTFPEIKRLVNRNKSGVLKIQSILDMAFNQMLLDYSRFTRILNDDDRVPIKYEKDLYKYTFKRK